MEQGNIADDLQIAGFWRRLGAFAIDVIVLGLAGLLIGTLFFSPLAKAGGYALIPGFLIALTYFGVGNSREVGGQTPGKKAMGIRVIDRQGATLSLPRAMLRYTILGVPYFLACIPVVSFTFNPLGYAIGVVAGFGQFAAIYLVAFNRRTRQALHDLVVGTYVVRVTEDQQAPHFATVWRGHWVMVGLIAVLVVAAPLTVPYFMRGDLGAMLPVANTLLAQPHVRGLSLSQNAVSVNGRAPTHSLVASIQLDAPLVEDASIARGVANVIGASKLDLAGEDHVLVSLSYGFSMGIARGSTSHGYTFQPAELTLAGSSGGASPAEAQ